MGTNVFEAYWDLLLILDTCRPDALRTVSDEYDFIDQVDERWSVGGDSWEWLANTFDDEYSHIIQNTAYITSNPNSKTVLENKLELNHANNRIKRKKVKRLRKYGDFNLVDPEEFGEYHSLYKYNIDQNHGMYPSPRVVSDYGIITDRDDDLDRIILHYMPPHWPFIASTDGDDPRLDNEMNRTTKLQKEPRDHTFEAYLDNLRWGLNEVSLVLENMDRDNVVLTADHGTAFSKYLPSHLSGSVNPRVRKVPWVLTTANDSQTYEPDIDTRETTDSPEELLKALGYTM